jgi:hypothetical protein
MRGTFFIMALCRIQWDISALSWIMNWERQKVVLVHFNVPSLDSPWGNKEDIKKVGTYGPEVKFTPGTSSMQVWNTLDIPIHVIMGKYQVYIILIRVLIHTKCTTQIRKGLALSPNSLFAYHKYQVQLIISQENKLLQSHCVVHFHSN